MILLFLYVLIFIALTSFSITILGDRAILSSDLSSLNGIFGLLINWKIYLAVVLAILARISFTLINIQLHKIPLTSNNSTNIASLLGNTAIFGVLITNYFFLGEILTVKQGIGMMFILVGVLFILIN